MQHIQNFNNFLLESFLNDILNEEDKKVGRIVIKDKEALAKMSVDSLKDLLMKVKSAVDKAENSDWSRVTPDQEKARHASMANGKKYMEEIASIIKDAGGDEGPSDKVKKELEKLQAEYDKAEEEYKAKVEEYQKASDAKKEAEKSEDKDAIAKAKEAEDKLWGPKQTAMHAMMDAREKLEKLKKKLK